jgi:carbon starvation protein
MGKARWAWITILPLAWLAIVTLSAGWAKIFSADPKLGFLAHARLLADAVAAGTVPAGAKSLAEATRLAFNDRLDAFVTAGFMLAVVVILADSAREWLLVVRGRKPAISTEVPYETYEPRAVPVGD